METIFDEEIEYFMSDEDVQPGQRWLRELSNSLDKTDLGILCLTSENISSQWIGFEAGWMAKRLGDGTVFPLLLDTDPEQISGPLSEFQCKRADLKGMQDIAVAINKKLNKSIKETILERRVRVAMQDFKEQLSSIIQKGRNELRLEYIIIDSVSRSEHLLDTALNFVRKARSSLDVLTSSRHFGTPYEQDSPKFFDTYLKGLVEHLSQHHNVSFREIIGPTTLDPFKSDPTWKEHFDSLKSLRKGRININLREMKWAPNELLIIADRRYVILERKYGVLVLNDPEGSVATNFSKEFAFFWDSGSMEVPLKG